MTAPIDPRIRSWLADPGQAVAAAPDERARLAAMALRGVWAAVPEARLVVLLSDVTGEARWAEALEEVGLSVVRGRVDETGCDAAVAVFTPEMMTVLARSPAEVWVDDGVLDGVDGPGLGNACSDDRPIPVLPVLLQQRAEGVQASAEGTDRSSSRAGRRLSANSRSVLAPRSAADASASVPTSVALTAAS